MGLVDLHSHVLPGLDDGAVDLEDAVSLVQQAAADGIEVVVATPHIRHDHDVRIGELAERARELDVELARRGVPVAIAPGGEVAEPILDELDETELRLVSVNQTGRWVLLEPRPGPLSDHLDAAVERLGDRGARAIVAHPERHLSEDFHDRLRELTARGALIQLTAALALEHEALLDLVRDGQAHLVASDAHTTRWGRPLEIARAIAAVEAHAGPEAAAFMRDAPHAILRGEDVQPPVRA